MKTNKIKVNKTAENPDGVEIEIVQPEGDLESRVLGFLLTAAMQQARGTERIPYKLPEDFSVEHRGQGTFLVMGTPKPPATAAPVAGGGYYQPPRPLAIVGLRTAGTAFDLIHAELDEAALKRAAEAQKAGNAPVTPPKSQAETDAPKQEATASKSGS